MSTDSAPQTGVHPSAVGTNPGFPQNSTDTNVSNVATLGSHDGQSSLDEEYPEQKHAGKVGLGPEYGKKNKETHGITAKIAGLKEEIKGTITRNHDLVEKGHDRRTGELACKEEEHKNNDDPFKKENQAKEESVPQPNPQHENPNAPGNLGHTPSTDHAARERAATTHPEGTAAAAQQATEGTQLQRDAQTHSVSQIA